MNKLLINKTDGQLGKTVDERELIEWEQKTGYVLPDDYRRFLLKYNGGMIKPWIFRHDHPQVSDDDQEMILDLLYDWERVVKSSNLEIARDMAVRPPDHIEIGVDPGGGRVLMSLMPEEHGKLVYWLPSYLGWGEAPNNVVGFIANSFTEFLQGLFDDGETEHGNWDVYADERPPLPLIL